MSCFGDFERHLFQVFVGDYIPLLLGDVKNEDIYQPLMNIALRWIKYPINYNYLIFTILIVACWLYTSTNTHVAAKIGKSSSTLLHLSIIPWKMRFQYVSMID